nr:hypothetical protein [Bacillus sp. OK048]
MGYYLVSDTYIPLFSNIILCEVWGGIHIWTF